jgi:outer membrane protein assembly factor BamB
VPTPIYAHGLVFITNAHGGQSPVYAVSASSASGDLTLGANATSSQHIAWSVRRGGTYMQTPIVVGELLFGCLDNGQLTCWDAKTGERNFSERVSDERKGFTASPVESGGRFYFAAEDGVVYTIAATKGFKRLGQSPLGEECMASPAISDGVIYFRTRGHLIAIGEK